MSDAYQSTRETVATLLASGREQVIIPTFQRGYMWQKKHVLAFWDDLVKQKDLGKAAEPHFFGRSLRYQTPRSGNL